jgi:hypothetical protein
MFKGIDKKRHTRAPYKTHNLEDMLKKDIPMLMRLTNDTFVALIEGHD